MQDSRFYWNEDKNKILKDKSLPTETFIEGLHERRNLAQEVLNTRSLAASTIKNPVTILNRTQQLECAKAYINNGIVRTVIDRSVFFTHGERTNFTIEPNEELIEGLDDVEQREMIDNLNSDEKIKELRRKIIRVNKRCELHDRSTKLLTSAKIFGRNALEIVRFPKSPDWPVFGEPRALKHLSSTRIIEAQSDEQTGEFEGFLYEKDQSTNGRVFLKAEGKLVPAFNDDNNPFDNSYYSGLSAVWPILSVAQTIDAINDEDLPEAARQVAGKFGIIYAGTSKKSTLTKIRDALAQFTWLVHNEEGLTADVHDLGRDLMELPNVQQALAKYICQSMSLPLFLLFEDTANFATANQVMQVYKAGQLNRERTWFRGILEKYWYDPILADHLNIELKDVISADIKIKAVFPDINFETRKEILEGDQIAFNMKDASGKGVLNRLDIAKDIGRYDIVPRIADEMADAEEQEELINDSIQRQREESIKGQQIGNKVALQNGQQPRKQPIIPDQ